MKKILLLLAIFLTFSCSTNDTIETEAIVDSSEFLRGKPSKCDTYVAPPEDLFITTYATQEVINMRELAVLTIERAGVVWRWDGDKAHKKFSLHFQRLACQTTYAKDANGVPEQYYFQDFIYRISIFDSNGTLINEGCFSPICDVTSYPVKGLIEGDTYTVVFTDFPEVTREITFIKEFY
jgi:hypothetical protein